jgi:hypothetical protein
VLAKCSTLVLMAGLLLGAPAAIPAQGDAPDRYQAMVRRSIPRGAAGRTLVFARTELYFGTARPDGAVSEEEFLEFLDREITPRFPAGLTLLKGYGQFLAADGLIVNEDSYLLILLYPIESVKQASTRIEAIRRLYKAEFQQEAVLRADDSSVTRVSF